MKDETSVVGILALQGDYQKHQQVLDTLDVVSMPVRSAADFENIDRLIIPGGESTVILDLLKRLNLEQALLSFAKTRPVWGTCAGMILLSSKVNDGSLAPYGLIDIDVDRNGYGRQYFSTVVPLQIALNGSKQDLDLVFIRAPRVTRAGDGVITHLSYKDSPVLLSQRNVLVAAFHPELTDSTFLHNYFVRKFVVV